MRKIGINRQPGLAAFQQLEGDSTYQFMGVIALTILSDGISRIDHFLAGPLPNLPKPIEPSWAPFFDIPQFLT